MVRIENSNIRSLTGQACIQQYFWTQSVKGPFSDKAKMDEFIKSYEDK